MAERYIFRFDLNKCVGCHACVVACMNENGFQPGDQWRNIYAANEDHFPTLPLFYLSLACNHCDDAPCLRKCPANAYYKDEKSGAIMHDPDKCMGCKYCTWVCPYDAPKYNISKGIIEKCTFCNHRIEENLKPSCANLCPVGALDFSYEEITEEEIIESNPVPNSIKPGIKIKKLRNSQGPELDEALFEKSGGIERRRWKKKLTAIEEWPLLAFTILSALLVGTYTSHLSEHFTFYNKMIFLGTTGITGIFSLMHLGKKFRAWRSVSNLKHSWLSREILFWGLFAGLVIADMFILHVPHFLLVLSGFLFLLAVDALYCVAMWRWPLKIHSAQTLFMAMVFVFYVNEWMYALIVVVSIRFALYLFRKVFYKRLLFLDLIRLSTFFLVVFLLNTGHFIPGLFLLFLGDLIDRIDFYNELRISHPVEEMQYKLN